MTARKPPATAWRKGQSGNPKGRPPGIRDRRHALRELIEPHARELIDKALELARAGDVAALRLLLERAVPPLRPVGQPAPFPLAEGATPSDAARALVQAVAAGQLAPDVGHQLLGGLAAMVRVIDADEIERRLAALEESSR